MKTEKEELWKEEGLREKREDIKNSKWSSDFIHHQLQWFLIYRVLLCRWITAITIRLTVRYTTSPIFILVTVESPLKFSLFCVLIPFVIQLLYSPYKTLCSRFSSRILSSSDKNPMQWDVCRVSQHLELQRDGHGAGLSNLPPEKEESPWFSACNSGGNFWKPSGLDPTHHSHPHKV